MKKKSFLLFFVNTIISASYADFIPSSNYERITERGVEIFIFNDIATAQIEFQNVQNGDFIWRKYNSTDIIKAEYDVFTTSLANVEANTGYTLEIAGVKTYNVYVINYEAPQINSIVAQDGQNQCTSPTEIKMDLSIPPMEYYTPSGIKGIITREFTLTYDNLKWNSQALRFDTEPASPITIAITSPSAQVNETRYIDSVLVNTRFTLSGDQFAQKFGIKIERESDEYIAVKPIIRAIGTLHERDVPNEIDTKNQKGGREIAASAPLDITLEAYKNALDPIFDYTWTIYNKLTGEMVGEWREKKFDYRFSDDGTYIARAQTITNNGCRARDSIEVDVLESFIEVPNVFTPNGDGINDEFRVAYKSIVKYNIWIYNRWGRLVYSSSSPDKGWDGYIGNAKAATGAYFYVIEYTTVKGERKRLGGDINLLR